MESSGFGNSRNSAQRTPSQQQRLSQARRIQPGQKRTRGAAPRRPRGKTSTRGMILIGVVAVLVVLFLVWGIRGVMGLVGGSGQSGDDAAQSSQTKTSSGDNTDTIDIGNGLKKVDIKACTSQSLTATTQVSSGIYPGTGATFTVTLKDVTDKQCSTTSDQFSLVVTSGGRTITDTGACSAQSGAPQSGSMLSEATPLLFAPGFSWTGTLVWDGRTYAQCKPGEVGGSGSYQAQILLDGKALGDPIPFTVN